jgi:hypothetical protein
MFLLFFQGPLYLIINLPLVLDLPIVLTHHLLGLRSDNLVNESLLRILRELLKPLLPLLHHFSKLLPFLKVGIMDDSLLVVLLFNDLLRPVPEPLLELALHDVLRLLLPELGLLVFLLALDLLGLVDRSHHRHLVLVELPLSLLVLHPLLLVQHYLELLPDYRSPVRLYLSLLCLLLLKLLQILLNIEPILHLLDLEELLPLLLAAHLRLQRLQVLLDLHLPLLHRSLLLKLGHLTLLGDHGRPLVDVAPGVQRQIADDRRVLIQLTCISSGVVRELVAAGGVASELVKGLLRIVQFQVRVQDLVAVWGRDQAWGTHLLLPKSSYFQRVIL